MSQIKDYLAKEIRRQKWLYIALILVFEWSCWTKKIFQVSRVSEEFVNLDCCFALPIESYIHTQLIIVGIIFILNSDSLVVGFLYHFEKIYSK